MNQLFHGVGDVVRRAADGAVGALADHAHVELADRQVLALGQIDHDLEAADFGALMHRVGHRAVERKFRQVHAEIGRQHADADLGMDQLLQPVVFCLRFGVGLADHGHDAGHHLDRVGRAAIGDGAPLDVGIKLLRRVEILLHGENHLRRFGGKVAAVVGLSGLHDHRMTLRRTDGPSAGRAPKNACPCD